MTSSPEDSPANPSATPAPGSPRPTRDGCGPSSSESFAHYDPDSSSWRMSQVSLLPEWATYSETWPRSGMTRSGRAFRQPLLAPRTYGGESSLLPTPEASNTKAQALRSGGRGPRNFLHTPTSTANQAAPSMRSRDPGSWFWPTPTASEAGGSDEWIDTLTDKDGNPPQRGQRVYDPARGDHKTITLGRAVRLWPTPGAGDAVKARMNPAMMKRVEQRLAGKTPIAPSGAQYQESLPEAVEYAERKMWSTPTARLGQQRGPQAKRYFDPARSNDLDDAVAATGATGGQLNPTWVEWLMGFPEGWTVLEG